MLPSLRAVAVLLVSTASWGQEGLTLRVEVPLVTVDVTVTSADGAPVTGLEPDDFQIIDEGQGQPLRYFGASTEPWHVYLLLDVSPSTQDRRPFMREVVYGVLQSLRPQDRIAIGAFGDDSETLVSWNDSPEDSGTRLAEWTDRDHTEGGTTEFYAAVRRVLEEEFSGVSRRRALVVVSDGRDVSLYRTVQRLGRLPGPEDDRDFRDVQSVAVREGIPIFFVAMNTDANLVGSSGGNEYQSLRRMYPDTGVADQYLEQVRIRLERLSGMTGGDVYLATEAGEIIPLVSRITETLGNAYSLGWISPARADDSGARHIQVRLRDPTYRIELSRTEYELQ